MPGVTNPVTMPLIGTQSPMTSMPSMPPGTGQVPSVPLAQHGNPSSLGMFGNFTNVSHQMGSQMGYPNDSRGYAFQTQNMSGNQHSAAAMNSEACYSRTHVLDNVLRPQRQLQLWAFWIRLQDHQRFLR